MAKMWNLDHQSLCTSISTVSDKINGLCANNDQLQNQLTLHSIIPKHLQQATSFDSPAEVVDKCFNCKRRKLNLIIYGLPELVQQIYKQIVLLMIKA